MDSVIFLGFSVAYLVLATWAVVGMVRRRRLIPSDLAVLVVAALVYDNAVIGLGVVIGEGPLLETLNGARYWLHALVTPLLVLIGWHVLVRAGVRWAASAAGRVGAVVLTAVLIVYELVVGALALDLSPRLEYGALSYANENAPDGPPVMVLIVAAALLVAGIAAVVKQRWPWLAVGTGLMVVGSAVPLPVPSGAVTNMFELILLISVLATVAHQDARARSGARRRVDHRDPR